MGCQTLLPIYAMPVSIHPLPLFLVLALVLNSICPPLWDSTRDEIVSHRLALLSLHHDLQRARLLLDGRNCSVQCASA